MTHTIYYLLQVAEASRHSRQSTVLPNQPFRVEAANNASREILESLTSLMLSAARRPVQAQDVPASVLCPQGRGQGVFEQGRHPSIEGQWLELHLGVKQAANFESAVPCVS